MLPEMGTDLLLELIYCCAWAGSQVAVAASVAGWVGEGRQVLP